MSWDINTKGGLCISGEQSVVIMTKIMSSVCLLIDNDISGVPGGIELTRKLRLTITP